MRQVQFMKKFRSGVFPTTLNTWFQGTEERESLAIAQDVNEL